MAPVLRVQVNKIPFFSTNEPPQNAPCPQSLEWALRVFSLRLWMENHWWSVRVFIKKQITKLFLEEIFLPTDSTSLRLRSAAFEMQLSHVIWGSTFKRPLLSALKQFLVFSKKLRKRLFTPPKIFSSQRDRTILPKRKKKRFS